MRKRISLLIACTTLGTSAIAHAEPDARTDAEDASGWVAYFDQDGDGVISRIEMWATVRSELRRQVNYRFQQFDRNKDGRIVRLEVPGMSPDRFGRFDLNGDGAFTLRELSRVCELQALRRFRRAFAQLDRDGDGCCNNAELAALGLKPRDESEVGTRRQDVARARARSAGVQ